MSSSSSHPPYHFEQEEEEQEAHEEDPYSSSDNDDDDDNEAIPRTRRTTQNIRTVQTAISTPPPQWDPQNRAFTSALTTIRNDANVKSHLERLEEMKRVGGRREGVLADLVYTEIMAVICHAARAVSLAGVRGEGEGREEFEVRRGRRARTEGGFCWMVGEHGSVSGGGTLEGDAEERPRSMDVGGGDDGVGGERRGVVGTPVNRTALRG
ncbi:hypothetical protein EG328_004422 [Venturia inaequalis]|uniref:Uncharacterized protein n=1 Tax=Venturia inaequalis TaxID=5025 RepID=A0A8H3UMQ7_VENIN|nr:hypothetical protein EG328_004422 [Venturia inaequalis]